jgi:hypothetical protein
MMHTKSRGLYISGGICAILWPILSQAFYAIYPLVAGQTMVASEPGWAAYVTRWAEMGQRSELVALEWIRAALPLLLLPFLIALYRFIERRGQRDLVLVAICLGLFGMALMVLGGMFHPALSHVLSQSYIDAQTESEGAVFLEILSGLHHGYGALNVSASLLYQGCVALMGLALILNRTWRIWGWMGLVSLIVVLPSKFPLGIVAPSNICWTGLGFVIWPIAMGIMLLREGVYSTPTRPTTPEML